MKKILLLFTILSFSVLTTACINNFAIQELNNKAESYMDKGDAQSAICRLKSSLDLDNEVFQTHYNLAVAYNSIGEYENSIEELKKAIELKPDFADAYYTLANAKEALAYELIENNMDENGNPIELSQDKMSEFNNKAEETIDAYNSYLAKKPNAKDTQQINDKIHELNQKIKDFNDIIDNNETTN